MPMITQLKRHIIDYKEISSDRNRGDPIKSEKFKEVNIAYNLLNNNNDSYNFTEGDAFNFSNINLPNLFSCKRQIL